MESMENVSAPIDFEHLREISDDDVEMMDELLELYFSQTDEQLNVLHESVSAKDFDGIYKAAHKIVGSSLTCGMNAIVPSIRDLEKNGRHQIEENVEKLFAEAEQAFMQMKIYLSENRQELSN